MSDEDTKRVPVGFWKPAGYPRTTAALWLVAPFREPIRYEAEVTQPDGPLEVFVAPTRAMLTQKLIDHYGRGE